MSAPTPSRSPLLEVQHISHHYRLPRQRLWGPMPQVQVLHDVSFQLAPGQSLGIMGESGSGKSTLARIIMALEAPSSGRVRLLGRDLHAMPPAHLRVARTDFQMVFQDPYSSLDPRQRIERIVTEPLRALGERDPDTLRARAAQMLERTGLPASALERFPHEFSGGQRQRIAIARALVTRPRLIVADEPLSALDVTIQAQVLDLMQELKQQFGLSFLLISHDPAPIAHLCEDVLVLHKGAVVERGRAAKVFHQPQHPYTQALVAAAPRLGRRRRRAADDGAADAMAALPQDGAGPGT
ncbi:ABC transporter ATP-binding protein [Allofranklinella schreckenbergeri]|uniref:ABC transporter ATP-binding protein n=1 Tax=Allofranklinella schreckenbergeri TaxID=1076744 RepID=A0A3M6PYL9_9BURK|nr:ABC transporter ATP-binding protein [Allofranklinella schreckenbergeri]RMW96132.1 ABC transporter ATP-binding protein [Allofranklinella schreckenbergeri]